MGCKSKKNLKRGTFFALFILCCCGLMALDPDQAMEQYVQDQWASKEGLDSVTINSIAQTADGYLWLATANGLVRFDGVKFSPLKYKKDQEIEPREKIFPGTLFVDKQGNLWIGDNKRLIKYQYQTGQFTTFTKEQGLTEHSISYLYEDMRGSLWIGFIEGDLNRFTNGKFTRFNLPGSNHSSGSKIVSILEDKDSNLLVVTKKNGIFQFQDNKFFKCDIKEDNPKINKMYKDRNGELWTGTCIGLVRLVGGKSRFCTFRNGLSNDNVLDILEDSQGNIWIGTYNGLNRLKKNSSNGIFFEKMLENHVIANLFEDKENNLWIGTVESGIIRLKDAKFISHASVKKNQGEIIYSVFEDRQGDTWIGANGGRLYRYRKGKLLESLNVPGKADVNIVAIEEDNQGNLWLGTCYRGVFQRKGQTNTFLNFTTRDGLADNGVNSIFCDSKNNLWISTNDGVSRYRNGVFQSLKKQDGLMGKMVGRTVENKNHDIWILNGKGINILKDGDFSKNKRIEDLKGIPVCCLYEDRSTSGPEGEVTWFGTLAGLIRHKNGVFTLYKTPAILSNNPIYQVFADDWENLWMSSNNGLLRASKDQLNRFAEGQIDKLHCTTFGTSDGMISVHFYNVLSRNCALKTREGELLFVTKKGITMVHPGKVKVNQIPPPVIIEDVFFNGRDRYAYNCMHLETNVFKGVKDIGFHFTAPTFLSPGKIKFKYKLEGHDKDWKFLGPGETRMTHYEDLASGDYTFRVTACNSDGIWNNNEAAMDFTLKPCFQNSISFKLLLFLGFLALGSAGYFLYKKYPLPRNGKAKYKNSPLNPAYVKECIKKLDYLMEVKKLYRDENISLQSLSEKCSIPLHHLSQIINKKFNKNFPDFINTYRIEEAKKILSDPQQVDQKILAIAYDVGFNTKVAFNSAFKKHTRMTPSQFRKNGRKSVRLL